MSELQTPNATSRIDANSHYSGNGKDTGNISIKDRRFKKNLPLDLVPIFTLFFVSVMFVTSGNSVFEFPKAVVVIFSALLTIAILTSNAVSNVASITDLKNRLISMGLFKQTTFFMAILTLSAFYSLEPSVSLMGNDREQNTVLFYAMIFVLMLLTVRSADEFREKTFIKAILCSVLFVSFYSIIQILGMDPVTWSQDNVNTYRSFSTFGNPLILASFSVLTIPLCLVATKLLKEWVWGSVAFIALILSFVSLIHTFSRAGWLAVIIGLAIMLFTTFIFLRDRLQGMLITTVIAVALSIFINIVIDNISQVNQSTGNAVVERIFVGAGDLDTSSVSRILVWKSTLILISEQPLIGYGPLTFTNIWPEFRDKDQFNVDGQIRYYDNPHNFYLELAVSGGAFLLLGFLWLTLSAFAIALRMISRAGNSSGIHIDLLIALLSSAAGFCIAIFFSFVTTATVFIFIYFLFLLAIIGRTKQRDSEGDRRIGNQDLLSLKPISRLRLLKRGLTAFIIMTLLTAFFIRIPLSEYYYLKGSGALDVQGVPSITEQKDLERSIELVPWRTDHQVGLATALFHAAEYEENRKLQIDLQNRAIDILGNIIEKEPNQRLAYYPLLDHAVKTKNLNLANEINAALLKFDPLDPIATYYSGDIALQEGDESRALKDYARSYKLQPLDLRSLRKMVSIYINNGNKSEAIRTLDIIISNDENDITAKKLRESLAGS